MARRGAGGAVGVQTLLSGCRTSGGRDGGAEIGGVDLAAGCDAPELLELAEEALDLVALSVDRRIDGALDLAVSLGRDVSLSAAGAHQIDDGLGVVASIGDEGLSRRQTVDQRLHGGLVRGLAGGEHDPQWQAVLIHQGVDLGAQSSTRTADGVIRAPFFPPAAC